MSSENEKSQEQEAEALIKEIEAAGYARDQIEDEIADRKKEFGADLTTAGAAQMIKQELGLSKETQKKPAIKKEEATKKKSEVPKKTEATKKKSEVPKKPETTQKKVSSMSEKTAKKKHSEDEDEDEETSSDEEEIEHPINTAVEEMDLDQWFDKYAYHKFLSLTEASDEEFAMVITGNKVKSRDSPFTDDNGAAKKTESITVMICSTGEERDLTLRRKFGSILKDFITQYGKEMPFIVKKKGTGKETSYSIKPAPEAAKDMKKAKDKKEKKDEDA